MKNVLLPAENLSARLSYFLTRLHGMVLAKLRNLATSESIQNSMKNSVLRILPLALALALSSACGAQETISLPKPDKSLKTSLVEALQNRQSEREFADKEFSKKDLATLLWAANGVNRKDGRRTAPSAMNRQDVDIYVIGKNGAYLWNAQENTLELRSSKDLRPAVAGRQAAVANAPVMLLLVSDGAKFGDMPNKFGMADAGYVSQNICLICAAEGWACVPRGSMEVETLKKELSLTEKQEPLLNNIVGYRPAKK